MVWDRDFADGQLVETELAFFAKDDRGTVWSFGEYPEEHEDGVFVQAPDVWISGMAGARGCIHMLAKPWVGTAYVQGLVPRIEFFDVAEMTDKGPQLRPCRLLRPGSADPRHESTRRDRRHPDEVLRSRHRSHPRRGHRW